MSDFITLIYDTVIEAMINISIVCNDNGTMDSVTNQVFWMYSVIVHGIFAIFQMAINYYVPMINCQFNGYGTTIEYINSYCLTIGTFTKIDNEIGQTEEISHKGYQYSPFLLLIAMIVSYVPNIYWNFFHNKLNIWNICRMPNNVSSNNNDKYLSFFFRILSQL